MLLEAQQPPALAPRRLAPEVLEQLRDLQPCHTRVFDILYIAITVFDTLYIVIQGCLTLSILSYKGV